MIPVKAVETTIEAWSHQPVIIYFNPESPYYKKYGSHVIGNYVHPLNVQIEEVIIQDDGFIKESIKEQTNIGIKFTPEFKRRFNISDMDEQKLLNDGIPYGEILEETGYIH